MQDQVQFSRASYILGEEKRPHSRTNGDQDVASRSGVPISRRGLQALWTTRSTQLNDVGALYYFLGGAKGEDHGEQNVPSFFQRWIKLHGTEMADVIARSAFRHPEIPHCSPSFSLSCFSLLGVSQRRLVNRLVHIICQKGSDVGDEECCDQPDSCEAQGGQINNLEGVGVGASGSQIQGFEHVAVYPWHRCQSCLRAVRDGSKEVRETACWETGGFDGRDDLLW
jgi:hypothetical protein